MAVAKICSISHNLDLIDLMPSIPGFEEFLGVYVLRGEKVALVDVGPSSCVPNLLQGLIDLNIGPEEVDYIFITHIHIDHAGGVGTLARYVPQAKIIVHERGQPHLADPRRLWEGSKQTLGELAEQYGQIEPVPQEMMLVAGDGVTVDLGGSTVIEELITPGHAQHHLSFLERKTKRLFVGEAGGTWCRGTIRPATPPPFNLEQALASLDKLIQLEPATLCYGHFGYADEALSKLRSYRDQLVIWTKVIAAGFERRADVDEICSEIGGMDEMLKLLEGLPESQRQRERNFILNSVRGFIDYFKRYGVPQTGS